MPYLRNAWYCAGWSSEIGREPVGRTYLGEPMLFYRTEAGAPVALGGRCPHRFAPLHRGKLLADAIECPYHGLVFGASGACVHNPHGEIPDGARLRTYPVEERDGVVWIWMGDPDKADSAAIVDSGFLVAGDHAVVTGYLRVEAHYQLVIDNLLDLTHPAILHRGGLSSEEYLGEKMQHRFHQQGQQIHSDYTFADVHASPQLKAFWPEEKADVRAFMTLTPASNLHLDFRMGTVGGDPDTGVRMPSLHLLVPESETSTHYFYAQGRNVAIDDEEMTAFVGEMARRAFEYEDEPMIRACQQLMGTSDLFSLNPVMLRTDVAAIRARILLGRLIDAEANSLIRGDADGEPVRAQIASATEEQA
jgi:vanillate O-demethylase monooxygenase subunit